MNSAPNHPQVAKALGELTIEIYPRGYDKWNGSSDQLRAAGLIPQGLEWPRGTEWAEWTCGVFDFSLHRTRPTDFKGRKRAWAEGEDHWTLRRRLTRQRGDSWSAARIHEKRRALEQEVLLQSQAYKDALGERIYQVMQAEKDAGYQSFRTCLLAFAQGSRA